MSPTGHGRSRLTKRWKLFLIPEEYSPPQVLKDTDAYLTLNRQRSLGDGFMQEAEILPPPGIEGEPLSSWSVRAPFRNDAFDRLIGKTRTLNVTDLEVAGESKE